MCKDEVDNLNRLSLRVYTRVHACMRWKPLCLCLHGQARVRASLKGSSILTAHVDFGSPFTLVDNF